MDYKKRIKKLEYEFGETNLNSQELVSPTYRKEINKKYYKKQNVFIIDGVLSELEPNVRKMLKTEVYQICNSFRLKELCWNCKVEAIIATIILYVWKTRHKKLRIEQTRLWKKYDLSWRRYALIMSRLLQETRAKGVIQPKEIDLNYYDNIK